MGLIASAHMRCGSMLESSAPRWHTDDLKPNISSSYFHAACSYDGTEMHTVARARLILSCRYNHGVGEDGLVGELDQRTLHGGCPPVTMQHCQPTVLRRACHD
eukprot:SAG11_NODE_747_length_7366_cov_7.215632_3_plen_103_part_00